MAEPGRDENGDPLVKGEVKSVGVGNRSRADEGGRALDAKLTESQGKTVLALNKRGVSTAEENSPLILACMMEVRRRVKAAHLANDVTAIDTIISRTVDEKIAERARTEEKKATGVV